MPQTQADVPKEIEAALQEITSGKVLPQEEVEDMVKQWQEAK